MIAIVLVGGKHTVIDEAHPNLPLSLIPIAGEPVIAWITKWLKLQGFKHIVLSAGFGADKITSWAEQAANQEPDFIIDVVSESRPLGTAGAVANAIRRYPSSTVLITNGDSLLLTDLKPSLKKLTNTPDLDGIIMSTKITNAGRFGALECDSKNTLIGFHEKQSGSDVINAGLYLLRSHLFESIQSDKEISLEYECFPQWIAQQKQILVEKSTAPFIDMGTSEAIKVAEALLIQHQAQITGEAPIPVTA